jgi:MurE/MurF fusion protein
MQACSVRQLESVDEAVAWLREQAGPQARLCVDSRQVRPGDVFIAWPGAAHDARQYLASALERGAVACLAEAQGIEAFAGVLAGNVRVAACTHLKSAIGKIADAWYGHPSQALDVVAITGTNGKTSTAWWLAQALACPALRARCGAAVVGTLGVGIPPALEPTGLTTPDPVLLHQKLRHFVEQGLGACVMEASSIGIEEHRLAGVHVRTAVFTNFTQDHLDYHGDMDHYWQAKASLFAWPGLRTAVLNADASETETLRASLSPHIDVWTYGVRQGARLQAHDVQYDSTGMRFFIHEGPHSAALVSRAFGTFNVSNLLAVVACLRALGHPLDEAVRACEALLPVPGRLQCMGGERAPLVCVDYAHTPDAIEKVLQALRPVAQARQGQLWCLLGCGGDRDTAKRPLMAAMAERHADRVMVTSDNPRSEDPRAIISEILRGFADSSVVDVDVDRASAIASVIAQAHPQDVVVLAGKGHEDYQEVAGVQHPFSDLQHAQTALAHRHDTGAGA